MRYGIHLFVYELDSPWRVNVVVGVSQWSVAHGAWLAEANKVLAQQFGNQPVTFPGHHGAFLDTPDRFATVVRQIVHENEQNERA